MKNDNYQKAANEIIKAVKEIVAIAGNENVFTHADFRKGKKLIIEMLKTNFISKKTYK